MRLCDFLGESSAQTLLPVLRVLLLVPVIQKDAEGVKPRCVCVWCWVRAGLERILGKEIKSENKKETNKN